MVSITIHLIDWFIEVFECIIVDEVDNTTIIETAQEFFNNCTATNPCAKSFDYFKNVHDVTAPSNYHAHLSWEHEYTVLEGMYFDARDFPEMLIGEFLPHQKWNVMLVKQHALPLSGDGDRYMISFEGTNYWGSWLADLRMFFNDYDRFFDRINKEISGWINKHHDIKEIHALVGHSAGAMFAKYVFPDAKSPRHRRHGIASWEDIGQPWIITFNGYDKYKRSEPWMVDIRDTNDIVSACVGGNSPVMVATVHEDIIVEEGHQLYSFDLDNVSWHQIDHVGCVISWWDAHWLQFWGGNPHCDKGRLRWNFEETKEDMGMGMGDMSLRNKKALDTTDPGQTAWVWSGPLRVRKQSCHHVLVDDAENGGKIGYICLALSKPMYHRIQYT